MSNLQPSHFRRIRSFVRRDSRLTMGQELAQAELWPTYGLSVENGGIDLQCVFGRDAPTFLEIGFGTGQSLLAAALANPDKNFIGVETHKPGIGSLCMGIKEHAITNLRLFYGDVIDVLSSCIPAGSLEGVQIFFPDPWPKRRHHQRRLIQPAFIALVVKTLRQQGSLHLATDWEHYANHMMQVLTPEPQLINLAGKDQFSCRSSFRPIVTKFENRAVREGRSIWELAFQKMLPGVISATCDAR